MAQQPLEILIKKGVGGVTAATPTNQEVKPETVKGETDKTKSVVAAQVINIAKQGMTTAISNYGAITGRAREQQAVENLINIAGTVTTFAVAGPVVGGFMLAGQVALSGIQSATNQALNNRQVNFDNARLGVITRNGNR